MKRCPQCRRDYYDETLLYCLDDGTHLLDGPASANEPATAILNSVPPRSEAQTQTIDPADITSPPNAETAVFRSPAAARKPIRTAWLIGGVALVIAALGYAGYRSYLSNIGKEINSVAVLPFENTSGDPNMDYLSDGISETVIDKLSQLPQLKVIARASSFKYRGPNVDLQDVANKLGVQAVVMGKVGKKGEQLSVRVEMVDVRTNSQLWGQQYNPRHGTVTLEQDIAQQVARELRVKLTGQQEQQIAKSGTNNPRAHELLLKGRYFSQRPGTEAKLKARDLFQQAIDADPNYAPAYANLSISYSRLAILNLMGPKEAMPMAEANARKALELDDSLPESHMALARFFQYRWQWKEAESEFQKAVELNPNLPMALFGYADLLSIMGRYDEALPLVQRVRSLDPLTLPILTQLSSVHFNGRRYDEALAAARERSELEPSSDTAQTYAGYALLAKGQYREAIASFEKSVDLGNTGTSNRIFLGVAYAGAGDREKAETILSTLRNGKEHYSPCELAILLGALGSKDDALASLEKAYTIHDAQMQYLKVDPAFDPLRDDLRFADLLRRVGLTE